MRTKSQTAPPSLLFHADSSDPDMLYFSRFHAFDPYFALSVGGRKIGICHPMEYGRMVAESDFDEVLLYPDVEERSTRHFKLAGGKAPNRCQVIRYLAHFYQIKEFTVGERFPAGLALALREAGVKLRAAEPGRLLPQREFKSADEVLLLKKGNQASAAGFRAVSKALAESVIRGSQLIFQGRVLTAERLRELIAQAALAEGAIALNTITASGDQACDCHNQGHGPIRPGELIVVDIFPRRHEDGYWGDMTRTFLKGRASDAQRRQVRTVKRAHELAMRMIKPGVAGSAVHKAVEALFEKAGYETRKNSERPEGFFHSLGHGVGIQVHEAPNIGPKSNQNFKKGMVVTVEPGLYYRGLGGVRIEDVVHVVAGGNEKISSAPYRWEIP